MGSKEVIRIEFLKFKIGSFYKVGSMVSVQDMLPEPVSKRPLSKSALICPISASVSNFGTLVKLQRYPRNTTCIPVVKIFVFLDLEQISADFEIEHFETASVVDRRWCRKKSFFTTELAESTENSLFY